MSLYEVKVEREKVLEIVKENKLKHDDILNDAVEGYWIKAEESVKENEKKELESINKRHLKRLKELRKERKESIRILKSNTKEDLENIKIRNKSKGFHYWKEKYPENHGDDYIGTIKRLELCTDNVIELNAQEFDSYIRNKWDWKDSFINTNKGYTCYAATGSYSLGSSYTSLFGRMAAGTNSYVASSSMSNNPSSKLDNF